MAVAKNQLHLAKRCGLVPNVPQHVFRQLHFGQTVQLADDTLRVQAHGYRAVERRVGDAILVNELRSGQRLCYRREKVGRLS